jgi:hypothetical protein
MGLLDRMKSALGGQAAHDEALIVEPPVDVAARRAQLDELEQALRELARAMAGDTDRMANPGWRGRIDDVRFAAKECDRLTREGFDRTALLDLAAEVRPLYGRGPVPAEYAAYESAHDRVQAAVKALRGPLSSESGPAAGP